MMVLNELQENLRENRPTQLGMMAMVRVDKSLVPNCPTHVGNYDKRYNLETIIVITMEKIWH